MPTDEAGHRIGRVRHVIGDPGVTEDVVAEVEAEVEAIRRADLGDLTGRAQQAVVLSRLELSPTQTRAAWEVLAERALDEGEGLVGVFDPTAAAVAAAAWLRGAAELAAEVTGYLWTEVVQHADDIETLPHTTPTTVLEALDAGATPEQAVLELVSDALAIGRGETPSSAVELAQEILEAVDLAAGMTDATAADLVPQLTPLNPTRPALDLLQGLLWGIYGCYLLWREDKWGLLDSDDEDHQENADTRREGDRGQQVDERDEEEDEEHDEGQEAEDSLREMFMELLSTRMRQVHPTP